MKKFNFICILLILVIFTVSCSIPAKHPEEGVWYCEELAISIDFSRYQDAPYQCATLYNEDGTTLPLACQFDYGNGITLFKEAEDEGDEKTDYLNGSFEWDNDEFRVSPQNGDTTYIFVKQES